MRGLSKKMLISILTSVVVFVTMIATTFAWVGIFTYASTDKFNLNLKVQDLDSNYFLTISSTGEKKSFSSEIPTIELERQIVNNRYDNRYIDSSNEIIENIFKSKTNLLPLTTQIVDNNVSKFYATNNSNAVNKFTMYESNMYYKFDLYLSVGTKEGINSDTTGISSNVFLTNLEDTITGTVGKYKLINGNPYIDIPSMSEYGILNTLPNMSTFQVNSKNAMRFSLSCYEPINIDDSYDDNALPFKTIIYQDGGYYPSIENDIYDLGGNLPFDYNTALNELLIIRPYYLQNQSYFFYSELEKGVNRGLEDLNINEENSQIINKSLLNNYLGCMNGIQTKMKITVHFWCEGWDADCLAGIDSQPVTLNLSFTSGTDD